MDKFSLQLEPREQKTPNQLRREGKVPATIYGPGSPSVSAQIDAREFSRLAPAAHSHIIELTGKQGVTRAIIRNVQRKGINSQVLNVEFYKVSADKKITVSVPLKFIGISVAVQAGGQIVEIHQTADLECLPGDIPEHIEIDLGRITEMEHGIHFNELDLGDKVKVLNPGEETIVRVVAPRLSAADKAAATTEKA